MSRLLKHIRVILADAERYCRAQGATCELVTGGRHPKLVIARGGRRLVKQICSTPHSTEAAINLARQDVRRALAKLAAPPPDRRRLAAGARGRP